MRFLVLIAAAALGVQAQDGSERLDTTVSSPAASPTILPAHPLAPALPAVTAQGATPTAPKGHDTSAAPSAAVGPGASGNAPADSSPTSPDVPLTLPLRPTPPLALSPQVVVHLDTSAPAMAKKSIWLATGLSLVLPGAGEQYLGATTRAKVFFAAELVSVAAAWLSWRNREDALVSARELASRYAGADAQDKSVAFLELMAQYRSRRPVGSRHDSYDEAMLLAGQSPDRQFPTTDSYTWDWGSTENPENDAHLRSFESQLRTYRASKVALSFSLGAMGVSRILSLADVLWLYRRASWVQAEVVPLPQGAAGRLAWRF